MLPAAVRMRHHHQYDDVVRGGARAERGAVTVHLLRVDADRPLQVGVVVNRRVGSAVVRNGVRRRLRHIVADRLDTLRAFPGDSCAVVVRAAPAAARATGEQLRADFDAALAAAVRKVGAAA